MKLSSLLKHVGYERKKWDIEKRERNYKKSCLNFGAIKVWRSKDQNSEEIQKVEDTKNQTIGGEFNESKYQIFEEATNSKSSILVSKL